ncbi:MAG: hypothetical protein ACQEQ0_14160 [Bacteroidota bacterium]
MKNIVITPKEIKREIIIWLVCLIVGIGMNIYAIMDYDTNWSELYSQFGYVLFISILLYLIAWILRGLFRLGKRLAGK